tara:strand:- start:2018 stop:2479 length:462 start_codon:yes stop_codon:yes gene_type:complete
MLNKFFTILAVFFSLNSVALDQPGDLYKKNTQIELIPDSLHIREPFTALAIAHLDVKNNTDRVAKIKKLTSDQARHVDIYKKTINEFGAEQLKRAKQIAIEPNNTTAFDNKTYQILFTGLKRKYEVGDEIELVIDFEDLGTFTTYLPVIASYK